MPSGYDNEASASAAAAAAAAAAAVDSGLVDDDQLVTMMTDASQPGATGKRKRDATDDASAAVGVVDPTPIFASDGRPLPPPQLPPTAVAAVVNANNNNQITIRPSPEGLPDKPKTSRINWGKSPHKERLTTILSDWFSKTGMALDPANNNAPIQDYRVYATKVGISRTTLFKYIHKDPSKRRMIKDDDSSGNRGKKRLMSDEDIKFIVKELKDGIKDDNSPPSRNEAVDLIIKHFGLSRQAASRQLSRHVLPLVNVDDSGNNNNNDTSTATAANNENEDEDGKMPAYDTSITAMEGIIPTSTTTTLDHPQEMKKRNIVISGVTSGLGRALLGYYYNHGHTVSGCGRRSSEITVLKSQFPNAHLSVVDVSDDAQVQAWAESIRTAGTGDNKVDLVIANAGISPETMYQSKKAWEVPLQDFDNTIDVNIKGVSNMIRHFVPRMVENNVGTFVALSSGLGRSPNPFHAAYCASKWAVEGMVKSLAMSLPEGPMCAVPLAPGVVQTDSSGKNDAGGNIDTWVEAAAPMILGLSRKDNGKSLSVKGFYSVRYRQTWSFPDGSGIPKQPGHVF